MWCDSPSSVVTLDRLNTVHAKQRIASDSMLNGPLSKRLGASKFLKLAIVRRRVVYVIAERAPRVESVSLEATSHHNSLSMSNPRRCQQIACAFSTFPPPGRGS